MPECIFCKIANKKIPADIIMENEQFAAFPDIHPKAPIHILIVPKSHIGSISTLSESDIPMLGNIIDFARNLAKEQGISESGFRLIFNSGKDAGMEVDHLHLHLLGGATLGNLSNVGDIAE